MSQHHPLPARTSAASVRAVVRPLAFASDAALVAGVVAREAAAIEAFYDRHAGQVTRVLARILGADRDLPELQHEVFVQALTSIETLQDSSAVKGWLASIAVFTARSAIRRRTRGKWLRFFAPEEVPEMESHRASEEVSEAVRALYAALDSLPADEHIAFALRFVDGMELTEVAAACGVSLSTIKRRVARAEAQFLAIARKDPALVGWVEGGARWGATANPSTSSTG